MDFSKTACDTLIGREGDNLDVNKLKPFSVLHVLSKVKVFEWRIWQTDKIFITRVISLSQFKFWFACFSEGRIHLIRSLLKYYWINCFGWIFEAFRPHGLRVNLRKNNNRMGRTVNSPKYIIKAHISIVLTLYFIQEAYSNLMITTYFNILCIVMSEI